ncbi:hypothetical protein RvY_11790 [Ramazzottius varieornatus]|uniref:Uncharacterized protein n=1 Tax=Ramazzottius varieornatus TaxID=947166 RepID=A0A1D1VHA5_RAMVA|nr:hypothetical protein RvY_11790 [Ramazzottius varieornatus]
MDKLSVLFFILGSFFLGSSHAAPQFPVSDNGIVPTKAKNLDSAFLTAVLQTTMKGAEDMLSPCNLNDIVRADMQKSFQKTKAKMQGGDKLLVGRDITRQMVLNQALPALHDGISLVRTAFVLQETSNLTVFLDQNQDGLFNETALANYTHYYIRAGNEDVTQILFIGLVETSQLSEKHLQEGDEFFMPAWDFLTAQGLSYHPRQYAAYDELPPQEAEMIMQKRVQMARQLKTQGTYFGDDAEYLANIMTVSFNGPENEQEFIQMLPKINKVFAHKLQTVEMKFEDKYESICAKIKADTDIVDYDFLASMAGYAFGK